MIRRVMQVVRWVLPLAALVVILYVVHGAGIPLTVPGVALVALLLVVLRVVGAMRRRRRRTPRD